LLFEIKLFYPKNLFFRKKKNKKMKNLFDLKINFYYKINNSDETKQEKLIDYLKTNFIKKIKIFSTNTIGCGMFNTFIFTGLNFLN
jgi:hypothetical protein